MIICINRYSEQRGFNNEGSLERRPNHKKMALFTKKDIALILPDDEPGDPVSLRHTRTDESTEQFQELKPKVDPSAKVRRYRAGQVPEFAVGFEEDRGFVTPGQQVRSSTLHHKKATTSNSVAPLVTSRRRIDAQVIKTQSKGSSAEAQTHGLSDDNSDGKNALDDSSSEDEDEIDRRRQTLRRKMLEKEQTSAKDDTSILSPPRRQVEAKVIQAGDNKSSVAASAESSSSESSSEWETDSDSDEGDALMKPVFVPKKARETIKRQEELEAEEQKRVQREIEKANARKEESRRLVVEELQREKEAAMAGDTTDTEMPDDTDGVDPEQEYRDWELREMRRIKRDRDMREQRRIEAEETLRRRNLTPEERQAEDEKLKRNAPKEKAKLKFMQKYYHKGAFYMDDESVRDKNDVRRRDASGATLEDNFNKELMPQVMQVKNFGRAGRTKYTHLAAEDTSRKDSLWVQNDSIREKFKSRLSGTRDISESAKRRKTEP